MATNDIAQIDSGVLIARYLSRSEYEAIANAVTGTQNLGVERWSDADLFAAGLVRVQAVAEPVSAWGAHPVENLAGEFVGPDPWIWQQLWDEVPDSDLATLKQRGQDALTAIIEAKTLQAVDQKGVGRVLRRLLKFNERARHIANGGPNDPPNYPLLVAHATITGLSGGAALADLDAQILAWANRAATLDVGEHTASEAIDQAGDAAAIKAALDTAAAL